MPEYKTYRDLDVWKKSRELVKNIYLATKDLPKDELYGLVSQMRRCAVSIPSNIAEGYGRQYKKETIHFLHIARGSLYELETQIIYSSRLRFSFRAHFNPVVFRSGRMQKTFSRIN